MKYVMQHTKVVLTVLKIYMNCSIYTKVVPTKLINNTIGMTIWQKANQFLNRVGSKGLVPLLSSHTTVRAVRHTAVC